MSNSLPGWLFVVPFSTSSVGGVSQVLANLTEEMRLSHDYSPLVLTSDWKHRHIAELPHKSAPLFAFRLYPFWKPRDKKRILLLGASLLAAPRCLFTLSRFLKKHDVAVINVHFPSFASLWFCLLKRLGLYRGRLILSFHGADLTRAAAEGFFTRRLWNWLFRCADAHIACSEAFADRLTDRFGPSSKIHAVHNGISTDRFVPSGGSPAGIDQYNLPPRYIASVATYEWKKGLDVLLRAYADIAKVEPDMDLVIAGRTASKFAQLQSLSKDLAISHRVKMLTDVPHEQIAAIVGAAELFVLASRQEPFGIAILEAGALGKPVVASNVGGIPEIICDDSLGVLVPPDDPVALADAMKRVIGDSSLQRQLGESLRKRVCEEFSWQRAYQQYVEIASRC